MVDKMIVSLFLFVLSSFFSAVLAYEQCSVNDQIFNKNSLHVIIKECCPLYFFQNIAINSEKRPFSQHVIFCHCFLIYS